MRTRRILWCLVLLSLSVGSGPYAQIQHIENRRIYDDSLGWAGRADVNFSAIQNRNLLVNLGVRPFAQFTDSMNYFLALGDYNYSVGEIVYAHSLLFHVRYNSYFTHRNRWVSWEMYAQTQFNPLLSQRVRALAGTGPRFRLLDKKNYKIFIGPSYMFEYEEIIADSSVQRNHRGSLYLSWFFNPVKNFSFSGSTYVQPLLTDFADYRVSGQYTLRFKIVKRTDFKFEFGFLYDSRPPQEVRNFIFNAQAGIGIDFTRAGLKQKKPRRK